MSSESVPLFGADANDPEWQVYARQQEVFNRLYTRYLRLSESMEGRPTQVNIGSSMDAMQACLQAQHELLVGALRSHHYAEAKTIVDGMTAAVQEVLQQITHTTN
ncbi:MAG: hypothetical protein V1876_04055 [Candidatus Peregrinibacteria bacterium]